MFKFLNKILGATEKVCFAICITALTVALSPVSSSVAVVAACIAGLGAVGSVGSGALKIGIELGEANRKEKKLKTLEKITANKLKVSDKESEASNSCNLGNDPIQSVTKEEFERLNSTLTSTITQQSQEIVLLRASNQSLQDARNADLINNASEFDSLRSYINQVDSSIRRSHMSTSSNPSSLGIFTNHTSQASANNENECRVRGRQFSAS